MITLLRTTAGRARTALLVALLGLSASGSVQAQTLAELKAKGKLVVGAVVDLAPFGMLNAKQENEGLDIDVARLVGRCLALPVEIVAVTGANRIPFLLTGRVDMLASALAITPERAKQVQFSRPYVGVDNVVVGRRDLKLGSVADLSGHRVGVPRSSTQEVALQKDAPPTARILRYDDQASTLQALLSGQVEAIGTPETILAQVEAAQPGTFEKKFSLFVQKNGLAVRQGQPEFTAALDKCLDEAFANQELATLYRKWFKAELPPL